MSTLYVDGVRFPPSDPNETPMELFKRLLDEEKIRDIKKELNKKFRGKKGKDEQSSSR